MPKANPPRARLLDLVATAMVTLFAMAMVVTPPPNLDLWWLMAVGRRMVETHGYIYSDPFTFTVPGAPWSPQGWLSALIYYGLFKLGGMTVIGVLRVVLAGTLVVLVFRAVRAARVSRAIASPLVMVAALVAHTRLTDRGQLFEYVFVAWLLGFLLTAHERQGRAFFLWPLAVELAWVQLHSSFLLGPVLVAVYFAGEWISTRAPGTRAMHRHDYRRAALLVLLLALVCVVNPNPKAFLIQPFDAAQHELISRFTLEWKSPFDPAIASGDFHPYYEIMLAVAALAILACIPRVPLGPALLMIATAYLSLQSHRFRVEFSLVATVMSVAMLASSALVARATAARRMPALAWGIVGLLLTLFLAGVERNRLQDRSSPDLLPERALAFAVAHDVAQRPFHPIGFGSYMLWDLYGERPTFIDGRNFDPGVYGDFLRGQTNAAALRAVIGKYGVDSFIIPAPLRADAGMRNVHQSLLVWHETWDLVYMDEEAFVYVSRAAADSTWLERHAYRAYHPLAFAGVRMSTEQFDRAIVDLDRVTAASPGYTQAWMDLGLARMSRGDFGRAVLAFTELTRLVPGNPSAHAHLARAYAAAGDNAKAIAACERALALDPNHAAARDLMQTLRPAR